MEAVDESQITNPRRGQIVRWQRGALPRLGHSSRCTVSGENAGRHTATYSAPPGSGVE